MAIIMPVAKGQLPHRALNPRTTMRENIAFLLGGRAVEILPVSIHEQPDIF